MFNSNIFQDRVAVVLGGVLFALLFGLLGVMAELVMGGEELRITGKVVALAGLAFVGYLGVAAFIRTRKGK